MKPWLSSTVTGGWDLCILLGATCSQCRQASKPSLRLLLVHKELAGNAPFSAGFVPWQPQAKNTDGIAATHRMVLVTSAMRGCLWLPACSSTPWTDRDDEMECGGMPTTPRGPPPFSLLHLDGAL
ncbi:hypothetical protein AUP68_14858 [Ilyonectria robusta]